MIKRLVFIAFIHLHINVFSAPIYAVKSASPIGDDSMLVTTCDSVSFTTDIVIATPDCTTLVTPTTRNTNVTFTKKFNWNTIPNAVGYVSTLSTFSNATDILNTLNLDDVASFDLPKDLPENTETFVTNTPCNRVGKGTDFIEESVITATSAMMLPFITTWVTTVINESITIPTFLTETYNYTIDWGDGVIDTAVAGNITHTYTTPGIQTISITGTFPRIFFNNSGVDRTKLLTIEQWGDIDWSSMEAAFYGCANLNITNPTIDIPNLSGVSNMASMFRRATNFNGDVTAWDVATITNMDFVFLSAIAFNQDIDGWNVSNVLTMQSLFSNAISFNQSLNNWNVGLVENMSGMFSQAITFNTAIDSWQVDNVTNMSDLFFGASSFNQNLNSWQVSNVENMTRMFNSASAFNGNITAWDVSNVTNMDAMFSAAFIFNQDISNWTVDNVEIFTNMFSSAWLFNQDIGIWNITSATNIDGMFGGTQTFNQDISNWDTSGITSMLAVFNNAIVFNQDISAWDVSNVTNMDVMFQSANSFDQDLSLWEVTSLNSASGMFNSVTLSTVNYDALLIGWNSQNLQSSVAFSAGNSKFCFAATERSNMITADGWIIVDGGSASDVNIIFDAVSDVTSPNSYTLPAILGTGLTGNERYYTEPNGNGIEYAPGDIIQFADFASYPIDLYIFDTTVCNSSEEQFQLVITMTPIPSCTNLITPLNMATNVSIATDLTWLAIANADGYLLTVGTTSGGTDILDNFDVGNLTTYDLPADLPENTEIFITIVPFNSIGNAAGCAEESFITETTTTATSCTTITLPMDGDVDVSIFTNVSWDAVANADGYRINIRILGVTPSIVDNVIVLGTTFDIPVDLEGNTTYYMTVIPFNSLGPAVSCAEIDFTTESVATIPDCTSLNLPLNGSTDVSITTDLTWNATSSPSGYFITIGTTSGGAEIFNNLDVGGATSYDLPTDLPENTEIFVTIIPYNAVGNATGCAEESFTTETLGTVPNCTSLTSPLNGSTNISILTDLTWTTVANAEGYRLTVGTTSGGTEILDNFDVGAITFYNLPNDLPENTEIFVTIIPYNSAGLSQDCLEESFITETTQTAPECTTLTFPLDGDTDISIATDLTWNAVANADGYLLTVGTASNGNDILDEFDVGNMTTYDLPTDLPESTDIYVTIIPYNITNDAIGCTEEQFTTETLNIIPQDDPTKYGFSPDGDGVNDYWRIVSIENSPNNEVIIYNRWGDIVFRIKGYDNNSKVFRGDANQKTNMGAGKLPSGTYFFNIQIDGTHNLKKTKGFVVIKR